MSRRDDVLEEDPRSQAGARLQRSLDWWDRAMTNGYAHGGVAKPGSLKPIDHQCSLEVDSRPIYAVRGAPLLLSFSLFPRRVTPRELLERARARRLQARTPQGFSAFMY